jgi:ELWxxDGT repeat protein
VANGTAVGTSELTGINGAATGGLNPLYFTGLAGHGVFFNGTDTSGLRELWTTDGTAVGTSESTLSDTYTGAGGLNPQDLTIVNGSLWFNGLNAANHSVR